MSVIVVKNRYGMADGVSHALMNCIPGSLEKCHRAEIVLFSTETRYFTFGIRNLETNALEFSEVRASDRALALLPLK